MEFSIMPYVRGSVGAKQASSASPLSGLRPKAGEADKAFASPLRVMLNMLK
jgi:hypothetical protein